ncbi:MAG TPA: ECF-type sigma factor [Bryobacteraceae bacterium]|nr:ECF-type sigma factor [Bryobacteraceae bacterium]
MDPTVPDRAAVTTLLKAWGQGDRSALDRLIPLVYSELHRRAQNYLARERCDHTLQPTALVHEAFLRLIEAEGVRWQDRAHFFAISAQIMRRILVDSARARRAEKRAGQDCRITLADDIATIERDQELVRLDDALDALARLDERKARVIELRFFGGLSVEEAAEVLSVSPQSVHRDWKLAKAWLSRELANASQ